MTAFITMKEKLKHYLLDAVISGEIGEHTEKELIVTTKEFVDYIAGKHQGGNDYCRSYLPSVSIEAGRRERKHNKFLFKVGRGIYKIHENAIHWYYANHVHLIELQKMTIDLFHFQAFVYFYRREFFHVSARCILVVRVF